MSTSNFKFTVGERVKVNTTRTTSNKPQWTTGEVIHQTDKKVCIQYDRHWKQLIIHTAGTNAYEWISNDDNKTIIKCLHETPVQYVNNSLSSNCNSSIVSAQATIPNPINEIHALRLDSVFNVYHTKWNERKQQFDHLSLLCKNDWINQSKLLIYVEPLGQLFAFVDYDIFYCDIKCKNQSAYNWKQMEIQLPFDYKIILAFKYVVFIFPLPHLVKKTDIYCIDLRHQKFLICDNYFMTPPEGLFVKRNDDLVHYMNGKKNKYCKWSLYEMIPSELKCFYTKKYNEPLIMGYIKEQESENCLNMNVPYYLKQIILMFYPVFIE